MKNGKEAMQLGIKDVGIICGKIFIHLGSFSLSCCICFKIQVGLWNSWNEDFKDLVGRNQ